LAAAACNLRAGSTPTSSFQALFEAGKKKDKDAMKKYLSKGTLEMFEGFAKAQNKSLDEMMTTGLNESASESAKMPETRNEKINGDEATLEAKDEKTGKWQTIPFVKEDGIWKLALDKAMRDAFKQLNESIPNSK
jgi:flagellar hook-associated protein FlgK